MPMRKPIHRVLSCTLLTLAGVLANAGPGQAADLAEYHLLLHHHAFEPATLKVPANTRFKVLVTNHGSMPAEFESTDFSREKIVMPNTTIVVFIGPLDKGTYTFYDDFHQATTGVLIAE